MRVAVAVAALFPLFAQAADERVWPSADMVPSAGGGSRISVADDKTVTMSVGKCAADQWPAVYFNFKGERDLSQVNAIRVTFTNDSERLVSVGIKVKGVTVQGQLPQRMVRLPPKSGRSAILPLFLEKWLFDKPPMLLGLKRNPKVGSGSSYSLDRVSSISIFFSSGTSDASIGIQSMELMRDFGGSGQATVLKADDFKKPWVDEFGQAKFAEWPDKVHSVEELRAKAAEEEKELAAKPNGIPASDRFGGWAAGPKLKATGFFRTEKVNGKWWFVDPDGHLFFGHGIECGWSRAPTGISRREAYFEKLPPKDGETKSLWKYFSKPMLRNFYGDEKNVPFWAFSFAEYNLFLKFGRDWKARNQENTVRRMKSWGINVATDALKMTEKYGQVPYVVGINPRSRVIAGANGYWGKLIDPFAPEFAESCAKCVERVRKLGTNEYCLGWTSNNELSWGNDGAGLARDVLSSPDDQPAKIALLKMLAEKGKTQASATQEDLRQLGEAVAEKYYSTVRAAIKAVAPNHLYLGDRNDKLNPETFRAASRNLDVLTVNTYDYRPVVELPPGAVDKPLMVSEFHFGCYDTGYFYASLLPVKDQKTRADCYRNYMFAAVDSPNYIGANWFCWQDCPITGQLLEGANAQCGLVTTTDIPYAELLGAFRDVSATMYERRYNGNAATNLLSVGSSSLEVKIDTQRKGEVADVTTARGVSFCGKARRSIFRIEAYRDDDVSVQSAVEAYQAKGFSHRMTQDGVVLDWNDLGEAVSAASARITKGADGEIRWHLEVTMKKGWSLYKTTFPRIALKTKLGEKGEDDAFVFGSSKGGVIRNPMDNNVLHMHGIFSYGQPGSLVAQFCSFFDEKALLYFAAEDGTGQHKSVELNKKPEAFHLSWTHLFAESDATGKAELKYDYVMRGVDAAGGQTCEWYDAADIYRNWAEKQRWCRVKLADRKDLPEYLRNAPGMVRFYRNWIAERKPILDWVGRWQREFPGVPLVAAMWGWEKVDSWITPDYFPIHGGDEGFRELTAELKKRDVHSFPWPSGYHWTLTFDKQEDGTFRWDDRERFNRIAVGHNVYGKDGKPTFKKLNWLRGGESGSLCGGDKWTQNWWNEDISAQLAARGCEMVQMDQVVCGSYPACWSRAHGHRPGGGAWKVAEMRRQLEGMRAAMAKHVEKPVVCYEEPEELWNDIVGIQDYRDCETGNSEWAGVFNYIYHEYVPCFQSNPRRGNRLWESYCCAEGQIPHFVPSASDISSGVLLENSGFEKLAPDGKSFSGWENPRYQHVDSEVRHDGKYSLRMETSGSNTVQVAKNISVDDFVPGRRYRVSAWLKSERKGRLACMNFAAFAPGLKHIGGGQLIYPEPKDGWQLVSGDFKIRAGGEMIRFMINSGGDTKIWTDSIVISEVMDDGSVKELKASGKSAYFDFMSRWMRLYHGEGRPYLAHGRRIRPPRLECETIPMKHKRSWSNATLVRKVPLVRHAAYEAADGSRALVLVNSTANEQKAVLVFRDGRRREVTLAPDEIRLLK